MNKKEIAFTLNADLSITGICPSDYDIIKGAFYADYDLRDQIIDQATKLSADIADADYELLFTEIGINIVEKDSLGGLTISKRADGVYVYNAPISTFAAHSKLLVLAGAINYGLALAYAKQLNLNNYPVVDTTLKGKVSQPTNCTGIVLKNPRGTVGTKTITFVAPTLTQPSNITGVVLKNPKGAFFSKTLTFTAATKSLRLGTGYAIAVKENGTILLDDGAGDFIKATITYASLPTTNQSDTVAWSVGPTLKIGSGTAVTLKLDQDYTITDGTDTLTATVTTGALRTTNGSDADIAVKGLLINTAASLAQPSNTTGVVLSNAVGQSGEYTLAFTKTGNYLSFGGGSNVAVGAGGAFTLTAANSLVSVTATVTALSLPSGNTTDTIAVANTAYTNAITADIGNYL